MRRQNAASEEMVRKRRRAVSMGRWGSTLPTNVGGKQSTAAGARSAVGPVVGYTARKQRTTGERVTMKGSVACVTRPGSKSKTTGATSFTGLFGL